MSSHWRDEFGFTVPHATVYPWLWLWDSCFHSVIWAALGDGERARRELTAVFAAQTPSGFVPHMNYFADGDRHRGFWGVGATSTVTQPPLYGHALAVLAGAGVDVGHLVAPVAAAFKNLFERRATPTGLLRIVRPWETGTDDSPRWQRWQSQPFDPQADRRGYGEHASRLDRALVAGAHRSGLAEYRHPLTGERLGARPQSWALSGGRTKTSDDSDPHDRIASEPDHVYSDRSPPRAAKPASTRPGTASPADWNSGPNRPAGLRQVPGIGILALSISHWPSAGWLDRGRQGRGHAMKVAVCVQRIPDPTVQRREGEGK
jgi:hypothetical protein